MFGSILSTLGEKINQNQYKNTNTGNIACNQGLRQVERHGTVEQTIFKFENMQLKKVSRENKTGGAKLVTSQLYALIFKTKVKLTINTPMELSSDYEVNTFHKKQLPHKNM